MSHYKGVPEDVINDARAGWRELVRDLGGVDRTGKVCGVSIGQVSTYGKIDGDSLPGLATVLAAEIDVGRAHVTEAMARATGHILVPIRPMSTGELAEHLARLGAETGDVFARYAAALSDGKICAEDKAAIACEAQDVAQAVHCLLGHLNATPVAAVPAAFMPAAQAGGSR